MKSLIAGGMALAALAGTAAQAQTFVYESTKRLPDARVDAAVQVATRKCDPHDRIDHRSAGFNKCMLSLGWRFSHYQYARRQFEVSISNEPTSSNNASDDVAANQTWL